MSVATPSAPPNRATPRVQPRPSIASSSTPGSSTRPVASRPAKPVLSRPPTKPHPAATSSTSVKSAKAQSSATPSASCPTFLVPGKDTSSSAGTVFAKPSKEWVLPERAKPGRKVSVEEPDSNRQSQNRQSQRAHRARRTDYITTLEERIRQFENDEIHSNVRLQEVARALKADNERLKSDIISLRSSQNTPSPEGFTPKGWEEERGMMKAEINSLKEEILRLRNQAGHLAAGGLVRMKDHGGSMSVTPHPSSPAYIPTQAPNLPNGIRHLAECPICPDPDPDCPCQRTTATVSSSQYLQRRTYQPDPTIPLGSTVGLHIDSPPPATTIYCGFCRSTDECVCRMIQEEEDVKPIILTPREEAIPLDDGCGLCADGGFCACAVARNSPNLTRGMDLSSPNSNMASAPIPLRKLRSSGSSGNIPTRKSIWALDSGVVSATTNLPMSREAVCSGDPRNCDACRNDTFGQEFCSNFFQSSDPSHSCKNCKGACSSSTAGPSSLQSSTGKYWLPSTNPKTLSILDEEDEPEHESGQLLMACCGNPGLCGHQSGGCTGDVIGIGGLIPGLPEKDVPNETISVDQAWKKLKAHPNAKFASLAFLADIVAQRSVPHAPVEEGRESPVVYDKQDVMSNETSTGQRSQREIKDGQAEADLQAKEKRKLVVESSAVRDALRALDRTPGPADEDERNRESKRLRRD